MGGVAAKSGRLSGSLLSQRFCFWISCPPVSSIEKHWLAKKRHLNITALQDVIEIINHTKLHALNSHLLAQPCEEMNALICSCTQKWDGFLKAGPWPVSELWEPLQRFLLEKLTTGSTYLWHRMHHKPCSLVWHIQPAQWTRSVTSAVLRLADKLSGFRTNENCEGDKWVLGVWTIQTLAEILKETEPLPSFS